MGKLSSKIALVTGGNSGIGLATAKEFVAEGAFVYITGRRQANLDAAVKEIGSNARRSALEGLAAIEEMCRGAWVCRNLSLKGEWAGTGASRCARVNGP